MDFLDPLKRRKHRRRLFISYVLLIVLVAAGTISLVLIANGYGINTKTGDIIQNGLVFVDSHPVSADISLNGVSRHADTSARLVLPAQNYELTLSRAGYTTWRKSFLLKEHSVERLSYPILFPQKPFPKTLQTYPSRPDLVTASPDRHWLLVGGSSSPSGLATIEQYDTEDVSRAARLLKTPIGLLTPPGKGGGRLIPIEWSRDNNHLLLSHSYKAKQEFIILDRNQPSKSTNINRLLKVNPDRVLLRDRDNDQIYIYVAKGGSLQTGDIGRASLGKPFLKNVKSFQPLHSFSVVYTVSRIAGGIDVRVWDGGHSYSIASLPAANRYLVGARQYQSHWYYALGSDSSHWLNIYKDPLDSLKRSSPTKLDALVTLKITGATKLTFSQDFRFVAAEAGQKLAVYDFEMGRNYQFRLDTKLDGSLRWADNYHLVSSSQGRFLVVEFDGNNPTKLLPALAEPGGFFSPNYKQLLAFAPKPGSRAVVLQSLSLVVAAPQLPRTNTNP